MNMGGRYIYVVFKGWLFWAHPGVSIQLDLHKIKEFFILLFSVSAFMRIFYRQQQKELLC